MAKLTAEQREALQRQLDDDDAADDDFEVEITDGDRRARVPYSKARKWLGDTFGIDLAEDTGDEPDEPESKPAAKSGGEVRRFGGRRVS